MSSGRLERELEVYTETFAFSHSCKFDYDIFYSFSYSSLLSYVNTKAAKELFDEEVEGHKAELELFNSTMDEHKSMSRQISMSMNKVVVKASNEGPVSETHTHPVIESSHEIAQARKLSAKPKAFTAERRVSQFHHTTVHHNQDHLFAKLADKEYQLKTARQELVETRDFVQSMQSEVEKLKRENAELVKLQGINILCRVHKRKSSREGM